MATDYNLIANEYAYSKTLPWRKHLESFTFFNHIGSLKGKSVLELACGDGFYTRLTKLNGAKEVIGTDLSDQMIALALKREELHPLGITYQVADALALNLDKKFDLVIASYLLNYAHNKNELDTMCKVITNHLKSGGRFVTINNNPDCKLPNLSMRKYGFERIQTGTKEGDEIIYKLFLPNDSHINIINYHLSKETHEECFEKNFLRNIQWHNMEISNQGEVEFGEDYWQDLLNCQPVTIITGEVA